MFVKIQLRLLLIGGGGHRPLSAFSKRLLIMGQGYHLLSATGGVGFRLTNMYKKVRKNPNPPVPEGGSRSCFIESFQQIILKKVRQNRTPPVADRAWGTPLSAFSKRVLITDQEGSPPISNRRSWISINQNVQKKS